MAFEIPSISTIITCGGVLYMSYSLWSIMQLFIPPSCESSVSCVVPVIKDQPKLQLIAYTSVKRTPQYSADADYLFSENPLNYNGEEEFPISVYIPKSVRKNGSMYMHFFLTSPSVDAEDWGAIVDERSTVYAMTPLVNHQVPVATRYNLLNDEKTINTGEQYDRPTSHIRTSIVINMLNQPVSMPKNAVPQEFLTLLRLTAGNKYLPVLYVDQLSQRLKDLVIVNKTSTEANITLLYSPISYGKLRLWLQFYGAFHTMKGLGFTDKDIDEVKGIFTDTNLYFLCLTFIIATLHMVFDFLSFKNDISFWKSRDDMGGISASSVLWRCFAQAVIFFYLMEEETSLLVLVPAGIGTLIEVWKVTKKFHIEMIGWKPIIKGAQSRGETTTNSIDSEALRYLSYILYPLCICGAIYSLLYLSYKSWYSWLINSLVNGVYAFGFLFMLPQLFINYKLKSVAHLPWRAFMYKAFNTFIDDFFAFVITMPTSHRLACFRDDVVFLIYLYQKWLYPVDKSRVNEFGQVGEDHEKKE